MRMLALADDLSGAAEVAALLAGLPDRSAAEDARDVQDSPSRSVTVHLTVPAHAAGDDDVTVVDTDSRRLPGGTAREQLRRALAAAPAGKGRQLFLKFDSLLRGPVGPQLQGAQDVAPVLFCPAVPALGRTVRDGVLVVEGVPLSETGLWHAEARPPAATVAEQLAPARTRHLDLATVRGRHLAVALRRSAEEGAVAVCDAESAADLDRIAAAGLAQGFVLAGAAGLAAAAAARLPLGTPHAGGSPARPARRDTLFVLGTASSAARRQADLLEAAGVPVLRLPPDRVADHPVDEHGTLAVLVEGPVDPARAGDVTAALTALAVRHHGDRHLVLSGGETAQAVLTALGITTLHPLVQAHPGAVVSTTAGGRLVTTRPGSYGAPTSLLDILTAMQSLQHSTRKVPS
ncbi:four-carbon acid sugar kinase family protein [Kocuria sp. WN036]|uniref:four-carbon acid sugar kinase family protein n=1 Tax=Kocuria sp. WN036 TaxID=2032628 RepID=UPI001C3EA032|nr:four-carbon acid sugar kinase family protein [Kocuria sp. WN036]